MAFRHEAQTPDRFQTSLKVRQAQDRETDAPCGHRGGRARRQIAEDRGAGLSLMRRRAWPLAEMSSGGSSSGHGGGLHLITRGSQGWAGTVRRRWWHPSLPCLANARASFKRACQGELVRVLHLGTETASLTTLSERASSVRNRRRIERGRLRREGKEKLI
jgi:hypothetical protein